MLHADLIGVLESSWHAVPPEKAKEISFRAPDGWQQAAALSCPDCHRAMEKYGYMGLAAIQINRCDPCAEIWLDTDELQNMVLALAKSNYRSESAWEKSKREEMDIGEMGVQGAKTGGSAIRGAWLFAGGRLGSSSALSLLSLLLS